jgi:hypothetical protein
MKRLAKLKDDTPGVYRTTRDILKVQENSEKAGLAYDTDPTGEKSTMYNKYRNDRLYVRVV